MVSNKNQIARDVAFVITSAGLTIASGGWALLAIIALEAAKILRSREDQLDVNARFDLLMSVVNDLKDDGEFADELGEALKDKGLSPGGAAEIIGLMPDLARALETLADKVDILDDVVLAIENRLNDVQTNLKTSESRVNSIDAKVEAHDLILNELRLQVERLESNQEAFNLEILTKFRGNLLDSFKVDFREALNEDRRIRNSPPLIEPSPPRNKSSTRPGLAELDFREQWMGFFGRETELKALESFAFSKGEFRWWAIVGDGGTGKSRLAQELSIRLVKRGWLAGELRKKESEQWFSTAAQWSPDRPTLIVIDYASYQADRIPNVLEKFHALAEADELAHPVRFLLVDRRGSFGAWFESAFSGNDMTRATENALRRGLFVLEQTDSRSGRITDRDLLILDPLMDSSSWPAFIQEVLLRLDRRDVPVPDDEAFLKQIDHITGGGRPLYLQIAAIVLAERGREVFDASNKEELLREILRIELEGRWHDAVPDKHFHDPLKKLLAFSTLCRGARLADAIEAMKSLDVDLHDRTICEHIFSLYRSESKDTLPCMTPDPLGELFLICNGDPEGKFSHLLPFDVDKLVPAAMECAPGGVGETLRLLAQDFPEEERIQKWYLSGLQIIQSWEGKRPANSTAFCRGFAVLTLQQKWEGAGQILSKMEELTEKDAGVAHQLLLMAIIKAEKSCTSEGAKDLTDWDSVSLLAFKVMEKHHNYPAVATLFSKAAVNAISYYGEEERWDELERWGKRIASLADSEAFRTNTEIRLLETKAAVNAISRYGRAANEDIALFERVEEWGGRIRLAIAGREYDFEFYDQEIRYRSLERAVLPSPDTQQQLLTTCQRMPGKFYAMQIAGGVLNMLKDPIPGQSPELEEDVQELDERLMGVPKYYETINDDDGYVDTKEIIRLWNNRKYLPDLGEGLVGFIVQTFRDDLIREMADDPWYSEEKRNSLLQLAEGLRRARERQGESGSEPPTES